MLIAIRKNFLSFQNDERFAMLTKLSFRTLVGCVSRNSFPHNNHQNKLSCFCFSKCFFKNDARWYFVKPYLSIAAKCSAVR